MTAAFREGPASLRPTARPRRRLDDKRREQLLASISEIVLRDGFAQTTVEDFAVQLRCSKATIYGLASSKESLVATAVKRFFREATAHIDEQVSQVTDSSERIGAYLAGVGTEMRRMSPACYADMVSNDSTRAIYAANSQAAARHVRGFIRDGVADGAFRDVNASFIGEAVSLLIEGIQHGELLARTGLTSGDAFTALSDLVLGALRHRE